jgi:extracellular elastinolytic metalloproteinase
MLLSTKICLAASCLYLLSISLICHFEIWGSCVAEFANSNPYWVARSFVTALLKDELSEVNRFTLRQDSYTDKTTGVTHVFFSQVINGIEVANGEVSVDVKGGALISYVDSVSIGRRTSSGSLVRRLSSSQFYRGDVPSNFLIDEPIIPGHHQTTCDSMQYHHAERLNEIRLEVVTTDHDAINRIYSLYRLHCERVRTPAEREPGKPDDESDPRNALLQFMVAATSDDDVKAEILGNRDQIRGNMTSWLGYTTRFEMIGSVPGTVSPVKVKPVYFQLPDGGDKTTFVQAWRVSALDLIFSASF